MLLSLNHTILWKERHRARQRLALLEDLNGLLPGRLLLVIDLAQIEHVALDDSLPNTTLVLDNAPVTVLFAVFLSRATAQKHSENKLCIPEKVLGRG